MNAVRSCRRCAWPISLSRMRRCSSFPAVSTEHGSRGASRSGTLRLRLNQSVIEEHFSDEGIMELADVVSFLTANEALEITFDLADLSESFLAPLRAELEREGIIIDAAPAEIEEPRRQE
jgi:hypothetical protein